MNRKQLAIFWIGVVACVLCALYPPWTITSGIGEFTNIRGPSWHLIWDTPGRESSLNLGVLGVELFIVAIVIGALIFTFDDRRESN